MVIIGSEMVGKRCLDGKVEAAKVRRNGLNRGLSRGCRLNLAKKLKLNPTGEKCAVIVIIDKNSVLGHLRRIMR